MAKKNFIITALLIVFMSNCFAQQQNKETLDYIEKYKDIAMTEMVKNKIPASITLAQGILESGNGKSSLASKGNNHFGIKCHKDWQGKTMRLDDDAPQECFRVYDSAEESYHDHSQFLKRDRYKDLFTLEITDYKGWAKGLKAAGYATLPTYASILIKLIENYNLTQYDVMVTSGKFKIRVESLELRDEEKDEKGNGEKVKGGKVKGERKKGDKWVAAVPVLDSCKVVGVTDGHHFIRENFGIKFIVTKENDTLKNIAKDLGMYEYQLVKYNYLEGKKVFGEGTILYIEPRRLRAVDGYKYHEIKQGETLSYVSQLYAVRLERIFKMNKLNENSVIKVGQKIRLR